jgi:hypothetical protein
MKDGNWIRPFDFIRSPIKELSPFLMERYVRLNGHSCEVERSQKPSI